MNKYYHIAKINFINNFVYMTDTLMRSAFIAIIIFIFIQLWRAVFANNLVISGFTITMMLWYLVMSESIVTCHSRVLEEIGDDVISGNIANYLNKPYNYIAYKYASTIGHAIFKFFLTFIICGIVVFLFIGPINITLYSIPFILLIVLLAITLDFLIKALLGIFALYFEDAKALDFIYSKILFTIGGMLLPLELFPRWLEKISAALPFSYVAYYPSKLFVAFSFELFFKVLLFELIWIFIVILLLWLVYSTYIKRLSINGG